MYSSPLRYPGGKALMTKFFVNLFRENGLQNIIYAEPYAGGAGAAINLLTQNVVDDIIINDANIGIFSFWHFLVNDSEHFIQAIADIPVTISEWHRQREVLKTSVEPSFELGVAVFFLSRTNRSGVITGGAIGGATEERQKMAKYKIDCRFNKTELLQRLRAVSERREHIRVSNMDALDFLRTLDNSVFVYLDPPYYAKGKCLYMNHYTDYDHAQLANFLQQEADFRWVLSYDDVSQIRELYATQNLYRFPLKYTVETKRIGYELLTHSLDIRFPQEMQIKRNQSKTLFIERIT